MNLLRNLSRCIFVWMAGIAGFILGLAELYRRLGQSGALENEAWFIHGVSATVEHLSQQKKAMVDGAVRLKTGVKGKTWPFNLLASLDMQAATARDGVTVYSNPAQTKRRATLNDFHLAVMTDDFDEFKTLTDPKSEMSIMLGYSIERKKDDMVLSQSLTNIGGALGTAEVVDEGANSSSASSLPNAQKIADGGSGLTMAKIRSSKRIMGEGSVENSDQYMFYSPKGMEQLLSDPTATSSDYSTINALSSGGFSMDATWYGAKWRESIKLYKTGNIRSNLRIQKNGVGLAIGLMQGVTTGRDPSHWNNWFAMIKLSGGAVRIEDAAVVMIDIDENV